jgi:hypothetical protein
MSLATSPQCSPYVLRGVLTQHAADLVSALVAVWVGRPSLGLFAAVILFSTVVVAFLTIALVLPLLLWL